MSRVTDLLLERYLADDLSPAESAVLSERLKSDAQLRERLEYLKTKNEEFLQSAPPEVFARRLSSRLELEATPSFVDSWRIFLPRLSAGLALFFVCLGTFWLTFDHDGTGSVDGLGSEASLPESAFAPPTVNLAAPEKQSPPPPQAKKPPAAAQKMARAPSPPESRSLDKTAGEVTRRSKAMKPLADAPSRVQKKTAETQSGRKKLAARTPRAPARGLKKGLETQTPAPRRVMRKMVMNTVPAGRVSLGIQNRQGDTVPAGRPAKLRDGESLVLLFPDGAKLFCTYAMTAEGQDSPVVSPRQVESCSSGHLIKAPQGHRGPTTISVFVSTLPFSTENILFDGFSFDSPEAKIEKSSFFAIF